MVKSKEGQRAPGTPVPVNGFSLFLILILLLLSFPGTEQLKNNLNRLFSPRPSAAASPKGGTKE